MPPFGPIKRADLIRTLRRLGFEGPYAGTRHQFMVKGAIRLRIPNPHRGDVGVDLLAEILRQGHIERSDWEKA